MLKIKIKEEKLYIKIEKALIRYLNTIAKEAGAIWDGYWAIAKRGSDENIWKIVINKNNIFWKR